MRCEMLGSFDPTSFVSVLSPSWFACTNIKTHKDAAMCLFQPFMKGFCASTLSGSIRLKPPSSSTKLSENEVMLRSYLKSSTFVY